MTTTPNSIVAVQNPKSAILRINHATGTTATSWVASQTNGAIWDVMTVTNTDSTTAYTLQLYAVISSTNYLLGSFNIPISAGNVSGTPPVSLLVTSTTSSSIPGLTLDANGNPVLIVDNTVGLALGVTAAVTNTAGYELDCFLSGAVF